MDLVEDDKRRNRTLPEFRRTFITPRAIRSTLLLLVVLAVTPVAVRAADDAPDAGAPSPAPMDVAEHLRDRPRDIAGRRGEHEVRLLPFVAYSLKHGFDLNRQVSSGTSVGFVFDTRDNAINADRGWYANTVYRTFFDGFIGGNSTWQQLNVDVRTYRKITSDAHQKVAFWFLGNLVTGGTAPYLDLPETGGDAYGRSERSRTNLCTDSAWGRQGSRGFYLTIQEAF